MGGLGPNFYGSCRAWICFSPARPCPWKPLNVQGLQSLSMENQDSQTTKIGFSSTSPTAHGVPEMMQSSRSPKPVSMENQDLVTYLQELHTDALRKIKRNSKDLNHRAPSSFSKHANKLKQSLSSWFTLFLLFTILVNLVFGSQIQFQVPHLGSL